MYLSTGSATKAHEVIGITTATSHLMLESETIDAFESIDQLFPDVQEKMRQHAAEKDANAIVDVRFNTEVVRMSVAPKFLVVTGYGTMVKFTE